MYHTLTRTLQCIIWIIIFSVPISAQVNITGTVTDTTGESLIGVSVRLKSNETIGTVTDIEGKYIFSAPDNEGVLIFSYVGFNTQEIPFTASQTTINVVMRSNQLLEEVIVVGYGVQKKSDVTGSISSTKNEDFKDQPISNIAASIQGKVSGINITSPSGTPGAGLLVSVRGQNNPLYVVDGIPLLSESNSQINTSFDTQGNPVGDGQNISSVNDINPDDIESIEILKDASATSIYGARAANGVILITTKRGKEGKTKFNLNYFTGIQQVAHNIDFQTSEEMVALIEEGRANDLAAYEADPTIFGEDFDPSLLTNPLPDTWHTGVQTNWMEEIFRTAPINDLEFSASGGNDKTRFYFGSSYFDQHGIIIESFYKRFNTRLNLDHEVSDRLSMGVNLSPTFSRNKRSFNDNTYTGIVTNAIGSSPLMPVYEDDGTYADFTEYQVSWLSDNPVKSAKEIDAFTTNYRLLGSVFAEYRIIKDLKFRTTWSADFTYLTDDVFFSPITTDGEGVGGKAVNGSFQQTVWLGENIFTYDKKINTTDNLNIVGGFTLQQSQSKYLSISGQGFPIGSGLQTASAAATITDGTSAGSSWALVSFLGRVNYSLKNKYLFSLSARADGSSRFSPSNQFGFFPAGSAGWRISEEEFWPENEFLSALKVRASYGVTGDQEIGDFQYISFYSPVTYNGQAGLAPANLADENLKWQSNTMFNAGLDYELYKGKIAGSLEYYTGNKTDLLSEDVIPGVTGFATVTRNYGNIQNSGIEFNADIIAIDRKDLDWNIGFNISYLHNEIKDLSTDSVLLSAYSDLSSTHILAIGQPLGSFWGVEFTGVDAETGDPVYTDLNGDGVIDDDDAMIVGNALPDFFGGLNTGIKYKKWDFSLATTFSVGNEIYNLIRGTYQTGGWSDEGWDDTYTLYQVYANNATIIEDRWQQPGDNTDIPRASLINLNFYNVSSQAVEDASYFRIRNLNIGYAPKGKANKRYDALRLYVQVQNVFTFTKYTGFDPEVSSTGGDNPFTAGVDYAAYPSARTYTVGFNLGF
ncbi:MAG: TonB-dependent receptor [Chitinophagales bacterium]|nr:TonB-dependent receptor [Chitinophagales bacterium]